LIDVKEETCKLIEAVKKHEEGAFEQLYNEFYKNTRKLPQKNRHIGDFFIF